MIPAINTLYQHAGRTYHLQAEDQGEEAACFAVRVYDQGSVLWQKDFPYEIATSDPGPDVSRPQREWELRALMEKTLLTVEAAIAKGKIG